MESATGLPTRPDFEVFRQAVLRQQSSKIPLAELLIDCSIQSRFLGRRVTDDDLESQVDFWATAGYDYIPITVGLMDPGKVTEHSAISRAIQASLAKDSDNQNAWNLEYTSFIRSRKDFEHFPWDLAGQLDLSKFEAVLPFLKPNMKVIAVSGKIFTLTWMLMGFDRFGEALLTEEQLVADVFRQVAEIQLAGLDRVLSMPQVGAVWVVDDLAFNCGPLISPQAFRDHLYPWYREISRRCRERGVLFFLHSDGDLTALLPDLIDLGLDALHPIDPTCMDIFGVKQVYGDRIGLIGNVSTEILRSGQPSDIEAIARELIDRCGCGGGFCLGSGNSVPEWASFDNYMAMRNTGIQRQGIRQ